MEKIKFDGIYVVFNFLKEWIKVIDRDKKKKVLGSLKIWREWKRFIVGVLRYMIGNLRWIKDFEY